MSRQFTADKTGKGQFFRGNRRNLAGEGVVRKSLSPQRVASMSNFCNSRSRGQGTWATESVAPVLASEPARSFPGSPAWPGTHWKLRATREERESERSQISQRDHVSPPQRAGAVPSRLSERWAEMARKLPRGAQPSGRPSIVWNHWLDNRFYRLLCCLRF